MKFAHNWSQTPEITVSTYISNAGLVQRFAAIV